jgi:hypothetical protein
MSVNSAVSIGEKRARARASQDRDVARSLYRLYSKTLREGCGGAPVGLAVGHLMRVNPQGLTTPKTTRDNRMGLMLVTSSECLAASVQWTSIEKIQLNAYAWGVALNANADEVNYLCGDLLGKPNDDFWRLAYLRYVMGATAFSYFWDNRDATENNLYLSFMNGIEACNKTIAGWTVQQQNTILLQDCPYTFNIARDYGSMLTQTFGTKPRLETYLNG